MMLVLESSTASGSVALFRDRRLMDQITWENRPREHHLMFAEMERLLVRQDVDASLIQRVAVGRGPGNYSGLRLSMTAANAFLLPSGRRPYAVSSGEALAWSRLQEGEAEAVAVIGDARRGLCWWGVYYYDGYLATSDEDWQLAAFDVLPELIPEEAILLSPDAKRIATSYPVEKTFAIRWPEDDAVPTADMVGRLALEKITLGFASEDLAPLYIQPPV